MLTEERTFQCENCGKELAEHEGYYSESLYSCLCDECFNGGMDTDDILYLYGVSPEFMFDALNFYKVEQ